MTGMIGIPCNDSARYSETYASICGMHLPESWTKVPNGATRMPVLQCRYASIAASLNFIARIFLEKTEHEWLFLLNDDHIYPPDILLRLLSHDKDVVAGVYLKKTKPFDPILYDRLDEKGQPVPKLFKEYESGLIPIVATGDGCLLIRRKVLEAIADPWWTLATNEYPDTIRQDLIFCDKVRKAGFQIYADLDALIGHIALVPIVPHRENGQWSTILLSGQSDGLRVPAAQPVPEHVEK